MPIHRRSLVVAERVLIDQVLHPQSLRLGRVVLVVNLEVVERTFELLGKRRLRPGAVKRSLVLDSIHHGGEVRTLLLLLRRRRCRVNLRRDETVLEEVVVRNRLLVRFGQVRDKVVKEGGQARDHLIHHLSFQRLLRDGVGGAWGGATHSGRLPDTVQCRQRRRRRNNLGFDVGDNRGSDGGKSGVGHCWVGECRFFKRKHRRF